MEKILQKLEDWGCDIAGTLERFLDDKELYISCLEMAITDAAFKNLGEALEENRVSDAFDYAHTLKGMLSNLGLTPMVSAAVEIVEPLRRGMSEGLWEKYEVLLTSNEQLKSILGK